MPGPRGKQRTTKKPKQRTTSQGASGGAISFEPLIEDIDGAEEWNAVARILCDYLELPDLTRRSGLKKVYNNFDVIYKRIDDVYVANVGNVKITGGIVAIYTKMCADSILRNLLFEKGLLAKIMPLIQQDASRHLALRALTTVTHHGGGDIRKEICLQTPVLIKILQDHPDDLQSAELAISTLAHAVGAAINEAQKPPEKYIKALKVPTLLPLIIQFISKPGAGLQLLHHALELLAHTTFHCWQACRACPAMIEFLAASLRSSDLSIRCSTLGALLRLNGISSEPDQRFNDPNKLIAAVQRGFPDHLSDASMDYGPTLCDSTLTLRSVADYQKAMMQTAQDRDLYKLGLTLAELITRNEFSVGEGGFQVMNERTGKPEFMDVGLPFKMWTDALPLAANAIRAKGRAQEVDLADMIDMKFFIVRARIPEATALAKKSIQRNPKLPYFYYVMTLGIDVEEGLRCAKKGLKCKNVTRFVRFGLMHRAVEIAGNLGVCRIQESREGDRKWEEGIAFLTSAFEDAKTYVAEAPPDARHMKNVLYWYICLAIAIKGPEMSTNLSELQAALAKLKIADDFSNFFGTKPPKTQLRLTQETILKYYTPGVQKWNSVVSRFDSAVAEEEHIISPGRGEDQLVAWLEDLRFENGDQEPQPEKCSHSKITTNTVELYRCSWCGNPSAVLRKCSGCEKARYCDGSCQKSAWPEHKGVCKS
ncbi:hypothetical protein PAXINDRAFT_163312 [Paxillus involutus ATCC 200175]|uniref:MYND-type domain-containing protein n=1 Tax=Paxillus involutus ATCC 200175 TaxID=664439 RepID=A0A0C9U556_PAXIN|nr:hypothetical protein PAXINDRAFT_163312 [Paxillus involutus ATCC 200175]